MNATTQYPLFLIPVIDDILADITSMNFMPTLDLTSSYFQIGMMPEDMAKSTFITSNGCFDFKRMSFGLSGALYTFQKAMNTILKHLIGKSALVYLDDVIVPAATFEEHLRLLREVLSLLRNAGLTVKLEKCTFLKKKIKYLGVEITQDGIKTDT